MSTNTPTYKNYRYTIKISLYAPLLSQASGGISYGLDASMLRNKGNTPALPGTLIRGNLKHNWNEFIQLGCKQLATDSKTWLGGRADKNYQPERGELHFDEYWLAQTQGNKDDILHRIKINEETGSVKKGAYVVIESPWKSGAVIEFIGHVHIFLKDQTQANRLQNWLYKGLAYSTALGAFKGIGFGRIDNVSVELDDKENTPDEITANQFGIKIKPDKAFCISQHQRGNNSATLTDIEQNDQTGLDNHFKSENFISGATIKGAIATQLRKYGGEQNLQKAIQSPDYPILSQYLNDIHISHAQPQSEESDERPSIPPISLVIAQNKLYDIINKSGAGLIHDEAPRFTTDWKDKDHELAEPISKPPARPHRRLSIHTAIEKNSDAAKEAALYSIDAIAPDKHHWLANITLPDRLNDKELTQLKEELSQLLSNGLHNIGKTSASATATIHTAHQHPCHKKINELEFNDSVIITLQSLSKILPNELHHIKASNDGDSLKQCYKNYFKNTGLTLENFYADHQFIGGYYWHTRYNQGNAYNPQIFTKAGSVFRFIVTDASRAQKALTDWQRYGIPSDNENWKENPYNRSNGYGEIAINLPIHWEREPNKQEANWEEIA